jgi:hypothetical protein
VTSFKDNTLDAKAMPRSILFARKKVKRRRNNLMEDRGVSRDANANLVLKSIFKK